VVIAAAFLALGRAAAELTQKVILPTAAVALVGAGVLGYLDVPTFVNIGVSTRRGLLGFSPLYGVLAVQCSLPLALGALLLVAGGGLEAGAASLGAFAAGIAAPVGLAVLATGSPRLSRVLARASGKRFRRYTHLLLGVVGLYLLLASIGMAPGG
jgi:cytochrome c biogenesis protein CcdA